ncbi:hypothetical protein ACRAWF_47370 [Streptomyces sp. L7]
MRLFSVGTLDEVRRMPWRARKRLRRVRERGRTGVLLIAEIREPVRSFTDRAGVVSLRRKRPGDLLPEPLCHGTEVRRRRAWASRHGVHGEALEGEQDQLVPESRGATGG